MRPGSKRQPSPNQAPGSISSSRTLQWVENSLWAARQSSNIASSTSSDSSSSSEGCSASERGSGFMSMLTPSAKGPNCPTSRPWTTKTTSCTSCSSSATRSPRRHCTHVCTPASSAMNAWGASLKSGNRRTVLLSNASESSRCTVGDSIAMSWGSIRSVFSLYKQCLRFDSTRRLSSVDTGRRLRKRLANATRASTSSSNNECITCVRPETIVPKKTGAMSMTKTEKSLDGVCSGWMSP
mmetsp:Transcript_17507/g.52286  ORF Transcript_17507/g.52286 Transcript_17507/m.52286 type:complete len:239 (-) Transcript_17507:933-1649(-)